MRAGGVLAVLLAAQVAAAEPLKAVATTTIVADVVRAVGGEHVVLEVLIPAGTDPHAYQPAPRDLARLAAADVVFANGLGLETFLDSILDSSGARAKLVAVSDGIAVAEAPDHDHADAHGHHHEVDPHVWLDPLAVAQWATNIAIALSARAPARAEEFARNRNVFCARLADLDAWIRKETARIPQARRRLVSDHDDLRYFARRYSFSVAGSVLPGFSTLSESSARQMADLQDAIRSLGVRAIFVGVGVNPRVAEQVAADTGVRLVTLHTGTLTGPDGPAPDYLSLMRYDVRAIVGALAEPRTP